MGTVTMLDREKFDVFAADVHPDAALFPIDADELQELIDDIAENGQQESIKVSSDGVIIDGRRRLEACRSLGLVPLIEWLPEDANHKSIIVSRNLRHRRLTLSQQSMIYAVMYPEPSKGGRGKKNPVQSTELNQNLISRARRIVNSQFASRETIDRVITGSKQLMEAFNEIVAEENNSNDPKLRIDRLPADLRDEVKQGTKTLDAAERDVSDRQSEERERRRSAFSAFSRLVNMLNHFGKQERVDELIEAMNKYPDEFDENVMIPANGLVDVLHRAAPAAVEALAKGFQK